MFVACPACGCAKILPGLEITRPGHTPSHPPQSALNLNGHCISAIRINESDLWNCYPSLQLIKAIKGGRVESALASEAAVWP